MFAGCERDETAFGPWLDTAWGMTPVLEPARGAIAHGLLTAYK